MASSTKLLCDILDRGGVSAWNQWRKEHAGFELWLYDINFDTVDLSGIDLSKAHLGDGYLAQCNLTGADFRGASLNDATLSVSDFTNATFLDADLSDAKLNDAVLGAGGQGLVHLGHLQGRQFRCAQHQGWIGFEIMLGSEPSQGRYDRGDAQLQAKSGGGDIV